MMQQAYFIDVWNLHMSSHSAFQFILHTEPHPPHPSLAATQPISLASLADPTHHFAFLSLCALFLFL